jgi:hypothetical protein
MVSSTQLSFDGDVIRYSENGQPVWELIADGILVIGESTNGGGANGKSHTYCFIDGTGTWFDASIHARGAAETMAALGRSLGVNLSFTLAAAPPFQSRVCWPGSLTGKSMFTFTVTPLKGFVNTLLRNVAVEQQFSDEVFDFINPAEEESSYSGPLAEVDEGN